MFLKYKLYVFVYQYFYLLLRFLKFMVVTFSKTKVNFTLFSDEKTFKHLNSFLF